MKDNIFRIQNSYDTNKEAAEDLKQYLDERYPWLEWVVIAYNNKDKNESDTKAAYFNLEVSKTNGGESRGKNIIKHFSSKSLIENN